MTTPTQRSLKLLRAEGYFCAIVEHWNAHCRIRQDLFGFADILAVKADTVLLVQTTSGTNVAARIEKIISKCAGPARLWLESPHRSIVVHGWRKAGPRGKMKRWECRREPIYLSMFAAGRQAGDGSV